MKKLDPQPQLPVHHPNGAIPAHSLDALAQIDHVVVVSAPQPVTPNGVETTMGQTSVSLQWSGYGRSTRYLERP